MLLERAHCLNVHVCSLNVDVDRQSRNFSCTHHSNVGEMTSNLGDERRVPLPPQEVSTSVGCLHMFAHNAKSTALFSHLNLAIHGNGIWAIHLRMWILAGNRGVTKEVILFGHLYLNATKN